MTDHHPLTESLLSHVDNDGLSITTYDFDEIVRQYLTPPPLTAESGVRFPELPDTPVEIAGNFITSGTQMQMVLVGTEPILVVQPEYDADEDRVTLITTAVDLPPAGLIHVLESLLDGARTIVMVQERQAAEFEEAVAQRTRDLQAAGPDEFPTGYYESLARDLIIAENTPLDSEQAEADQELRRASEDFELAQLPGDEGFYDKEDSAD